MLDDLRQTPAERINDGRDFVPTNRWVVFGHTSPRSPDPARSSARRSVRSSAICRAPCGLSSAWCWAAPCRIFILTGSLRRDGKSLGQMARDEIGVLGGFAALAGVLMIMVILIAVLGW